MHGDPNGPAMVAEAFSRQSAKFDAIDARNPSIGRMRHIVREAALRYIRPGESLLELNAGTGLDSFFFAEQGIQVLATDHAPGMVARMQEKQAARPHLPVEVRACSFLDLGNLGESRFNHVFSNFGGLNCTAQLGQVLQDIDRLLLPGGTCTLVIMPKCSPWEVMAVLKGHFKHAFRRWRKGGSVAHLEGVSFRCHYYSPAFVQRTLGAGYNTVEQRALALLAPPPHAERFPARWPRLCRWLVRQEDRIAHRWPFRQWGDHFLIILRKQP